MTWHEIAAMMEAILQRIEVVTERLEVEYGNAVEPPKPKPRLRVVKSGKGEARGD